MSQMQIPKIDTSRGRPSAPPPGQAAQQFQPQTTEQAQLQQLAQQTFDLQLAVVRGVGRLLGGLAFVVASVCGAASIISPHETGAVLAGGAAFVAFVVGCVLSWVN